MHLVKFLSFALFLWVYVIHASTAEPITQNEPVTNAVQEKTAEQIRKNESVINALQRELDDLQAKGQDDKGLQEHMDEMIKKQNALLAQQAGGEALENNMPVQNTLLEKGPVLEKNTMLENLPVATPSEQSKNLNGGDLEERIRAIVRDELSKQHSGRHPTDAEQRATKLAEANAPQLPEQKSEAMAQYELALEQYKKKAYKEAASGFARIIKTYRDDPIAVKAMVHLAYCLEKQDKLEDAATVCESALQKKLDDVHQADCKKILSSRDAKSKGKADAKPNSSSSISAQKVPLPSIKDKN